MTDDDAVETFYTDERWQNWLDRLEEEDLDPENEDSARLLLNLQDDDAAIAVVKVLAALDDERIDEDRAVEEIRTVRDIVLADVEFDDEDKVMLIDGVQTSLVPVFYAAEESSSAASSGRRERVRARGRRRRGQRRPRRRARLRRAGRDSNYRRRGSRHRPRRGLEYGLVSEWVNGLDSLQSAIEDPEVVEEEG